MKTKNIFGTNRKLPYGYADKISKRLETQKKSYSEGYIVNVLNGKYFNIDILNAAKEISIEFEKELEKLKQ